MTINMNIDICEYEYVNITYILYEHAYEYEYI